MLLAWSTDPARNTGAHDMHQKIICFRSAFLFKSIGLYFLSRKGCTFTACRVKITHSNF